MRALAPPAEAAGAGRGARAASRSCGVRSVARSEENQHRGQAWGQLIKMCAGAAGRERRRPPAPAAARLLHLLQALLERHEVLVHARRGLLEVRVRRLRDDELLGRGAVAREGTEGELEGAGDGEAVLDVVEGEAGHHLGAVGGVGG